MRNGNPPFYSFALERGSERERERELHELLIAIALRFFTFTWARLVSSLATLLGNCK
jgi:hypothetical protein